MAYFILPNNTAAAASASASGIVTTGTQSFAGVKTFTSQPVLTGVTDGSAPGAGIIGQVIANASPTTLVNGPSTTQYGDIANISLTAGNWAISVNAESVVNTATGFTASGIGIGTATGNSATGTLAGVNFHNSFPPTANCNAAVTIARYIVRITVTTIYYLKSYAEYTGGTPQFRGSISAERIP